MKNTLACLLILFSGIVLKHDVEAAPRGHNTVVDHLLDNDNQTLLGGLGQCLQVNCFVDPCMVTTCPAGTTCRANYCGGCNAECVHGNLLDQLHTLG